MLATIWEAVSKIARKIGYYWNFPGKLAALHAMGIIGGG